MLWSDRERFGRFFDPWREFERMSRAFTGGTIPTAAEFPAVNIWISGDDAVVTAEIPGIAPDAIDISVIGNAVTLRGSRQPEVVREGEGYHRRERWQGEFAKTLDLPFAIDANKVEASFGRGVLQITLPRAEADKPRKIAVKSA
ncbi:MAG: Hsp20/alpha crystallin family protein [Nitrospirota bacterium]